MRIILFALALCSSLTAKSPSPPPNILFIFSDDHAIEAISAYSKQLAKIAPTPSIDRLAHEGMIFNNSFCANSICGPSRACIQTGMHSHLNGFMNNVTDLFDGDQTTFPKLLRKGGYQTALIGKWHLVTEPQGFDHWEILPSQGSYYNPDFIQMNGTTHRREGYVSEIITELTLDWLKTGRDPNKPFLLMAQHKAPHRNWSPSPRTFDLFKGVIIPEPKSLFDNYADRASGLATQEMSIARDFSWSNDMKLPGENLFPNHFTSSTNHEFERMTPAQREAWDTAYERENQAFIKSMKAKLLSPQDILRWKYQRYMKDYLRCVRSVDDSVGEILNYLDESGLAKNTIVIYSSDQGFYLGEHGWFDKRWMFEESMKMPFLIRWPDVIQPGIQPQAMIQNIDYAPTFLEIAGIQPPASMQGKSFLPVLKRTIDADFRDAVYYHYYGETDHNVPAHDGVRTLHHKLMYFPSTKEWNLFDLDRDPLEMKSVHADPNYAELLTSMKKLYTKKRDEYVMNDATTPSARGPMWAEDPKIPAATPGDLWWPDRHRAVLDKVKQGGHELVFIGDSITQGWERAGKNVWDEYYTGRKALNLGFSGDRTEHVLWRLMNGELKNVRPKVFVVMIGTNNTGHKKQDPAETALGIRETLKILRDRSPESKILLLSIFPRGATPDDPLRLLNDQVNKQIQTFADGDQIHWLDLSSAFLDQEGMLSKDIMPQYLHPNAKGYQLWAEAMEPILSSLGGWPAKAHAKTH